MEKFEYMTNILIDGCPYKISSDRELIPYHYPDSHTYIRTTEAEIFDFASKLIKNIKDVINCQQSKVEIYRNGEFVFVYTGDPL